MSERWIHVRSALAGLGLGGLCCDFEPHASLVLSEIDGRMDTIELGADVRVALEAHDIEGDGDDELVAGATQGVVLVQGDGEQELVWSGDPVVDATWVDDGTGAELFVVTQLARSFSLTRAACDPQRRPQCETTAAVVLDADAYAVVAADFDEDGLGDAVVVAHGDVQLHRGLATGLTPAQRLTSAEVSRSFAPQGTLVTDDIDVDGHADVAVLGGSDEAGLKLLFGDGDGGFAERSPDGINELAFVLQLADVVGDELVDVIVVDSERAFVFEQTEARKFEVSHSLGEALGRSADLAIAGEFDGRPGLDLLLSDHGSTKSTLASFSKATAQWMLATVQADTARVALSPLCGDLDGDGRDAVLRVSPSSLTDGCG